MPRATTLRNTDYRSDRREPVVFETIVIVLALIMIISGFSLYVGRAFAAPGDTQAHTIRTETPAPITARPFSLAET
ncbi:hypothetical protein [Asticcacaulis benevestitus]|uniref:Uncharacterized protein n=1 Tax=Asticcacaulis benevestitus DSM 16100 = ATCC BAA-896 TaxID=1121022 RepID=V4P9T5_9CAUL|nr:hypothetical protein [Asticcacaulis benevestitus]ESQ90647.1 hypothetical protein ABENE_11790 [Asticcacaulis benevestitus DSM 16100 = ATCC BAA-896]